MRLLKITAIIVLVIVCVVLADLKPGEIQYKPDTIAVKSDPNTIRLTTTTVTVTDFDKPTLLQEKARLQLQIQYYENQIVEIDTLLALLE